MQVEGGAPAAGGPPVLSPRPLLHCERLLELLIDLLSQLPTRRCVRVRVCVGSVPMRTCARVWGAMPGRVWGA